MSESPLISIILPFYNRSQSLALAIDSVLNQVFDRWELLLIDDGSTDGSSELATDYAQADPRILHLEQAHLGVSAARNAGLKQARGQIASYLDSDNTWRSNYLLDVWRTIGGQVNASCFAAMKVNTLDSAGQLLSQSILSQTFERRKILRHNQIDMNTFSHSIDLCAAYGCFDESMTRLCDWDLILRYTSQVNPVKIQNIGADYFHHKSPDRVSISEAFAPNRLSISLKNSVRNELRAVFIQEDKIEALQPCFEEHEFPTANVLKRGFDAFHSPPGDILIWEGSVWDSVATQMNAASQKLEFGCCVSFYLLPSGFNFSTVSLITYNRFHFFVAHSESEKQSFIEHIRVLQEKNNQVEVNPVDRVLLLSNTLNDNLDFQSFCERIISYAQDTGPTALKFSIATGSNSPQSVLRSSTILHTGLSARMEHSERVTYDDEVSNFPECDVFVYLTTNKTPVLPAKEHAIRCLYIIEEREDIDAFELAQFDALIVSNPKQARSLRAQLPLFRIYRINPRNDKEITHGILSIVARLKQTCALGMEEHKRPRISFVTGDPTSGSTRKRAHEYAASIEHVYQTQLIEQEKFDHRKIIGSELIIIQRWVNRLPEQLEEMYVSMARLRPMGKLFVYDLDDYVLHYSQGLPKTILSLCDRVSCSTPHLKSILDQHHNDVVVTPNMADSRLLKKRSTARVPMRQTVISVSTDGMGYAIFCQLAERIHKEYSTTIKFVFVSVLEMEPHDLIHAIGPTEPDKLFQLISNCDVMLNIAEISDQLHDRLSGHGRIQYNAYDFINSKSAIKYHDAALCGIPIITSDQPVQYSDWITHNTTGVIAENNEALYVELRDLLDDQQRKNTLADNALNDVILNHTHAANFSTLLESINEYNQLRLENRLGTQWHSNDSQPAKPNALARHARSLELSRGGEQKVAELRDELRTNEINLRGQQIERLGQQVDQLKIQVSRTDKELARKQQELSNSQSALEDVQQKLAHYQASMATRIRESIRFRLERLRGGKL